MAQQLIPTDVAITGTLSAAVLRIPNATITDVMVQGSAGIQAQKLQHQYEDVYAQVFANNAAVERKAIHAIKGATATVLEFAVFATTAATGNATATIDCLVNGVSILTAAVVLDSTTAAFVLKTGALATTALTVGQVIEVNVSAVNAGTGTLAKGLSARVSLREDAQ